MKTLTNLVMTAILAGSFAAHAGNGDVGSAGDNFSAFSKNGKIYITVLGDSCNRLLISTLDNQH